jgi:hypothetical protein
MRDLVVFSKKPAAPLGSLARRRDEPRALRGPVLGLVGAKTRRSCIVVSSSDNFICMCPFIVFSKLKTTGTGRHQARIPYKLVERPLQTHTKTKNSLYIVIFWWALSVVWKSPLLKQIIAGRWGQSTNGYRSCAEFKRLNKNLSRVSELLSTRFPVRFIVVTS